MVQLQVPPFKFPVKLISPLRALSTSVSLTIPYSIDFLILKSLNIFDNDLVKILVYDAETNRLLYESENKDIKEDEVEGIVKQIVVLINKYKEQNKKLTFLFGECTDSSEVFWNNMGWKRIYLKKKDN